MKSHDLARLLLAMPDLPIVHGLASTGYGEGIEGATVTEAYPWNEEGAAYEEEKAPVIDIALGVSTHLGF